MIVPTRRVEAGLEETPQRLDVRLAGTPVWGSGTEVPTRMSRSPRWHLAQLPATHALREGYRYRRPGAPRQTSSYAQDRPSSPPGAASPVSSSRYGTFLRHAVERIVSLCNHMFGDAQSALADYVQSSLMLRANKRFHLLRAERAPIFLGPSSCGPTSSLCVLGLARQTLCGPQFVCRGHL